MKKLLYILFFMTLLGVSAQGPEARKKIEAAKIALITERLDLTPEQAEKFWPIYREFGTKRKEIRRDLDAARKNFDPNKSDIERDHNATAE